MKPSISTIRSSLKSRLLALGTADRWSFPPEWGGPPWPEFPIMLSWRSDALLRDMRIQEAVEEKPLPIDYFFSRAGRDHEYEELCVIVTRSDLWAERLYEVHKLWFSSDSTREDVTRVLEPLNRAKDT